MKMYHVNSRVYYDRDEAINHANEIGINPDWIQEIETEAVQ